MTKNGLHGHYFEELEIGMAAALGKTLTEADVLLFAAVSGDTNPSHLNEEFSATTRMRSRVVHGMLTASLISAVFGTRLPGPGCLYVNQTVNFRAPVRPGDTVTARVEVTALRPGKNLAEFETICTVDGATVVDGTALIWVPSRD